jgi:hypothetical protein
MHGGTRPRVDRVWHPADFPKGYHALPGGKPGKLGRWWVRDVAPGTARGRAAPSRRNAPQPQRGRSSDNSNTFSPAARAWRLGANRARLVVNSRTQSNSAGHHVAGPRPCPSWSGTVCTGWRVKDSNLGRHQPTDLQSATVRPRRRQLLKGLLHCFWVGGGAGRGGDRLMQQFSDAQY